MHDLTKLHIYFTLCVALVTEIASSANNTIIIMPAESTCTSSGLTNAINSAMNGYDPMKSNPFALINPGHRNQIFKPFRQDKCSYPRNVRNAFIDKAVTALTCSNNLEGRIFRNYIAYKNLRQSGITFTEDSDKSVGVDLSVTAGVKKGPASLEITAPINFHRGLGHGRKESTDEMDIKEFFLETNGEVLEFYATCITHIVAIASDHEPVFTDPFTDALRALHTAAMDPNSARSNKTFARFVRHYGTHYMIETHLGIEILFQKLFLTESRSDREFKKRKKCVENSVRRSASASFIITAADSFSSESSKCDESSSASESHTMFSVHTERILSIGVLPSPDFKNWSPTAMDNPVPISFVLDKISHLTKHEWLQAIPISKFNNTLGYLNGSLITSFLEYKYSSYCELVHDINCLAPRTYCHHNDCPAGTFCVTDGSAKKNYRCARGEWHSVVVQQFKPRVCQR